MRINYKRLLAPFAMAIICVQACPLVQASGFQLNEYSAAGLGRGYAGEGAIADTAGAASRNPATIMMFDRPAISVGTIFIDPAVDIRGQTSGGDSLDIDNIVPSNWVPNLHIILPVNSRFGLSFSVNSNYGLGTEYNANYLAGEIAGTTSLITVNSNLSGAVRLSPHWSVGVGFDAVYGRAKLDRFAGYHTHAALPVVATGTSIAHMTGDGWGYGWNAGILWQINDHNRYGLTYRSKIEVNFHGNFNSQLPVVMNRHPGPLPWATGGENIPGTLNMSLPEMWELSGYNRVTAQWAVHYGAMYTRWSQFRHLQAAGSQGQTLFYRQENFHDAWRLALGTTYYVNPAWTLRAGIAWDKTPICEDSRSISIPDQDRIWLSAGARYAFTPQASVDMGIAWMHGQSLHVDDAPYTDLYTHATAWLYGVNFNYLF